MKSLITSLKVMTVSVAIMLASSCGKQADGLPSINGVKGPFFNVVNGQLLITMKFLNVNYDNGLKAPIPETRNSSLEFAPNLEDGGMMLQLYVDAEDLASVDIGVGDANTLPDGRALPGIPGGHLENSLRIDTKWKDISFYFSKKVWGLWMPFGFETAGITGYWNMKFNGKRIGAFILVGDEPETAKKAGGVIFLNIDAIRNKQVQMLLEKSKRNPHLIY